MDTDPVVSVLPIYLSNSLEPNVHVHQFPLLTRPLQVPPSAQQSGKRIRARVKHKTERIEIRIPMDVRAEVWNRERAEDMGRARFQDDQENNSAKGKENSDQRLTEVRLRSEQITQRGAYMLGIVREGRLYLHPISQTHQMRPTLTYMDVLLRKSSKRSRGGAETDSDEDDGPPPDPDDPAPVPSSTKKDSKPVGEAKEVQVTMRKSEDKNAQTLQGGLSSARREMLRLIREEEDEEWQDIEFWDGETEEAGEAFKSMFAVQNEQLLCDSDMTTFVKSIPNLHSTYDEK